MKKDSCANCDDYLPENPVIDEFFAGPYLVQHYFCSEACKEAAQQSVQRTQLCECNTEHSASEMQFNSCLMCELPLRR